MATKKIEIQDSNGNVYYPHTEASVVKNGSKTVAEQLNDKVNKTSIINNCNATEEGFVLDAMQGKYLNDKLNNIGIECVSIEEKSNNTNEYYGCLIEAGKTYLVIIDEHNEGTNISGIGIYILQSAMYSNSNCVTLKICDNLPINVLVLKNSENHIQVNFDSSTYSTIKIYKLK